MNDIMMLFEKYTKSRIQRHTKNTYVFSIKQWLSECAWVLRHTYIACLL
jgi:hypothetical protein